MSQLNHEIAILGAGIGGLTTAIALCQRGFSQIKVYERQESSANAGAGLVLWPNATCILHHLGLDVEISKIGGRVLKMIRQSSDGELLGELSITDLEKAIGFSSYAVSRHELTQILLDKLKGLHIDINYSRNVENIYIDKDNQTCVEFSDEEKITPDIIIGADGRMKSIARKFVTGNNKPFYQHYVNWVGLIDGTPLDINQHKSVQDYWGVGERFGYVPISDTKSYWAGCKRLPLGLGEPSGGNKHELVSIFKSWSHPVREIIEATAEENIRRIEVFDNDPIQQWHLNNVCLLGDAAHAALPTSGQGACQAIEDAWHFAQCLSNHPNDLDLAFTNFEKLRYDKTKSITLGARGFAASLFNEDKTFCKIRNENAKKSDTKAQVTGMSQLWGNGLPEKELSKELVKYLFQIR
ncbi:FAD-dependent monooxygenase [Reichenbachiella sp. MALMAid0571]|uniref:FAD-dependent monooxygenase n=1 Tax=Reichenbachiella sp. MALMAid0571 TaxID=3143939 RepID=UPI0032DE6108